MKRCLVLGANGFIGRHVVLALLAAGYRVRVYERRSTIGLPVSVDRRQGLLEDDALLMEAMRDIEAVIYLSWTGYPATIKTNFALDLHANLLTALKVMEAGRHMAVPRLIFASSGGTVYGFPHSIPIAETHPTQPISAHGLGKLMAEQYLAVYRQRGELKSLVLRPANSYGPYQWPERRQGFIATALGRVAQHRSIEIWGDGETVRDYVYVTDVVQAFMNALDYQAGETVFNIGSGIGLSLKAVLAEIERVTQRKLSLTFLPSPLGDVPQNVLDITRARQELHWEPRISLLDGLRETWQWIKESIPNL